MLPFKTFPELSYQLFQWQAHTFDLSGRLDIAWISQFCVGQRLPCLGHLHMKRYMSLSHYNVIPLPCRSHGIYPLNTASCNLSCHTNSILSIWYQCEYWNSPVSVSTFIPLHCSNLHAPRPRLPKRKAKMGPHKYHYGKGATIFVVPSGPIPLLNK